MLVRIFLSILLFSPFITKAQNPILKKNTTESITEFNMRFIGGKQSHTIDGLIINITPKFAGDLDSLFEFESLLLNDRKAFIYKTKKESIDIEQTEKTETELFNEAIDHLFQSENITSNEAQLFRKLIPKNDLDQKQIFHSNPYKLQNKDLCVFEISFENTTNKFLTFSNDFILQTDNRVVKPLSSKALSHLNDYDKQTELLIDRYNFNKELTIPPNTSTTKYFSVYPVLKNVILYIFDTDIKFTWLIHSVEKDYIKKNTYYFLKFNILSKRNIFLNTPQNHVIILAPNHVHFVTENQFYIEENQLNKYFEAKAIILKGKQVYFSSFDILPLSLLDMDNNNRITFFSKARRLKEM